MRVYRAPRLFDGRDLIEDGAVRVDDSGRIAEVGQALSEEGAEVVACAGTLMPGLVDAHVHLCLSGGSDPRGELEGEHPARTALRALRAAEAHLGAGVTTVRDLGGVHGIALELSRMVEAGLVRGPRILAAGHALCITGGHGAFIGREVDGPWEVARAVREELRDGAGCIKVVATGGMMTPGVEPGAPQMRQEEMAAAVAEARRSGRRVAAHAQGTVGIKEALLAGVSTIEHGIWIDARALELFLERGAWLVPTFNAARGILAGRGRGVPDFVIEKMERAAGDHVASFRRAVQAGVQIAAGTDAGTPLNPHGGLAGEVTAMIAEGLPVLSALRACTSGAAEALGLPDLGRLAPGFCADLVEVDGDPLTDPACLARVRRVVKDGEPQPLERLRAPR